MRGKSTRLSALTVAGFAAGLMLIGTAPATATAQTSSATGAAEPEVAEPDIPVLGQAVGGQSAGSVDPTRQALVSLHGVRRADSSTVVYWSAGWTPDTESGDRADLTNTFSHSLSRLGLKRPHGETTSDVAVVDVEGMKAYTPVINEQEACYCSDFLTALPSEYGVDVEPAPGKAYVMYAILPELPESLESATVKVAGKVFTDVPVEDGEMTPEVDADEPILVGTGWPELEPSSIQEVGDLDRFVYSLSKNSAVLDSGISNREEEEQTSIDISASVLFDIDEAALTENAAAEVRTAAGQIKDSGITGAITVTGHTDSVGTEEHNQDLSERRAEAVVEEITAHLPDDIEVESAGKGETEPIASNETDAGKQKNRRVTITIPGDAS